MAQSSGPISQGTPSERQMTDVLWRDLFGDEAGVFGDSDGSAYAISLPADTNLASIGSASIDSIARVAGFAHKIPANQPETIDIPVASGTARTDIIGLRYDPSYTGQPGPVRLVRIAGTSSAVPTYDSTRPGVEDLPLWSVTRQPGQSLSQATVVRMFPRIVPSIWIDGNAPLPLSVPIGTTLRRGPNEEYTRLLDAGGVPIWQLTTPQSTAPVDFAILAGFENWGFGWRNLCYWREERTIHIAGAVRLLSDLPKGTRQIATLPSGFRPLGTVDSDSITTYAYARVLSNGQVQFVNDTFNATITAGTKVSINMSFPIG